MKRLSIVVGITVSLVIVSTSFNGMYDSIPETWDMNAIKRFHLPPPDTSVKVKYASKEYYYSLPEHVIYKTYPVYVREFERPGYLDSLRQLEPEIVFDPSKLKTPEDWIKAGEVIFNWPVAYSPADGNVSALELKLFNNSNGKITADGIYPFSRYVINEKGKMVTGSLSCASCHTQVIKSGEIVVGGQGNIFNSVRFANAVRSGKIPFKILLQGVKNLTFAPWAPDEISVTASDPEEFARYIEAIPAGVVDRQGCGFLYPLVVPSLIGIKDIKYLDHTGIMRHDGPGDMMRYTAFNQGMDMLTSYNGFVPLGNSNDGELPSPDKWTHPFGYVGKRYSDAQLFALTQYIYSLTPPENPNHFPKDLITRGELVFKQSGCVTCHTPPLYTNNKLTPVNGFEPPEDHFKKYDIFNVSVETDSVSALYTRRGTGYYKVPSLRGAWFKIAFFHNGSLTTVEEVLDATRLKPDYVPSGYKPPHLKTMPVKGHEFGMDLSEPDKKALIAFIKTL